MAGTFVSYSHRDADWVRELAGRLHQAGVDVFFDEWDIVPGDVVVHSLEAGVRESASGILVFSPDSVASPWVMQEYAALLGRAVTDGRRFIPVIYRDAKLPEFAATRVWVDFRDTTGAEYEARLTELVRALQGRPPGERPPR